jgi:hypothetical protein
VTYFFDNCFSPRIVRCLREFRVDAQHLQEHFSADTQDEDWLPEVDRRRWIVLSGDQRIRKNPSVKAVYLKTDLIVFFAYKGFPELPLWPQALWVFNHWEVIERAASRAAPRQSFEVNVNGKVELFRQR